MRRNYKICICVAAISLLIFSGCKKEAGIGDTINELEQTSNVDTKEKPSKLQESEESQIKTENSEDKSQGNGNENNDKVNEVNESKSVDTTKNTESKIDFEDCLEEYASENMEKADGWSNGSMFDCTWRESNISFQDGIMNMVIDTEPANSHPAYSGSEYRTRKFYHYGKYETKMKPIKNDGVVSSFFIYTGPSDGNPWDEIDIEFLGKDTTKVQFNYFTDGKGNHEFIYDLGFDAAEEFHEYGFEWKKDSIAWFVDGKEVHTATNSIPVTPAKIMMNVWPGVGVDGWLNAYDGKTPLTAQYDLIRYTEYVEE